jgi:sulfotransferase
MVKNIFFNASLPRAGSTLIQNILMQNHDIYSTPTSGVIELLSTARTLYSNNDAFRAQDAETMKSGFKNFCNKGFFGFYDGVTDRPYVMEKSRGWLGYQDFVEFFMGKKPKIICLVRDLRSIFASMEKNFRKNPDKDANIINLVELKNMTTTSRIEHYSVAPPIGPSLEWLSEVFQRKQNTDILFIRFEDLTSDPDTELKKIYNYLELPYYQHDFNNVEQITKEDDEVYGIYGDHKIKNKIESLKPDYKDVLGINACNWIKSNYQWFYDYFGYF